MAGILWGSDPFVDLVEKATSELLPAGQEDISLNLEICDQVRAKQVQPKHAMQVIKRRLGHKNPNVAMLALGLTDVCIKNGGDHFLAEVASREFMDNLVSILRDLAGVNVDLKSKSLGLIQNWSQIAEARPASASSSMGYITQTYQSLQEAGFEFPPRDPAAVVSAALVETMTAPEWIDGDVCMRCRTAFTTFNRKHHCRNCGNVFDAQCSSHSMSLPWFGVGQDVRVCEGCYAKRAPPKKSAISSTSSGSTSLARSRSDAAQVAPSGRGGAGSHHRSATMGSKPGQPRSAGSGQRRQREEDDMALAIRLSLESSGPSTSGNSYSGYVPSSPPAARATRQPDGRMLEGTDADDDPGLAAALAASLRDYAPPAPSAPTDFSQSDAGNMTPRSQLAFGNEQNGTASRLPLPPSLELANADVDALLSFTQGIRSQEVQAAQTGVYPASQPGSMEQQQVYTLHDKATAARPRLARNLEEGNRRLNVLTSMHDKLGEAVHLYNRILDSQLTRSAASYAPQQNGQPYGYTTQQHPSYAPQPQHWGYQPSEHERYAESSARSGHAHLANPPSTLYPSLSQQSQPVQGYAQPLQYAAPHGVEPPQGWQSDQQHQLHHYGANVEQQQNQAYETPYAQQHRDADSRIAASPSAPPQQAYGAAPPQTYQSTTPLHAPTHSAPPPDVNRQETRGYAGQAFSPTSASARVHQAPYGAPLDNSRPDTLQQQQQQQQQHQSGSSPYQQHQQPWQSLQALPSVSTLPTIESVRNEAVQSPSLWTQSASAAHHAIAVSSAPSTLAESGLTPVSIEDATGKGVGTTLSARQEPALSPAVHAAEGAPPLANTSPRSNVSMTTKGLAPNNATAYDQVVQGPGQTTTPARSLDSQSQTQGQRQNRQESEQTFDGWKDIPIAPTAPPVADEQKWRESHRQLEPSLIEF